MKGTDQGAQVGFGQDDLRLVLGHSLVGGPGHGRMAIADQGPNLLQQFLTAGFALILAPAAISGILEILLFPLRRTILCRPAWIEKMSQFSQSTRRVFNSQVAMPNPAAAPTKCIARCLGQISPRWQLQAVLRRSRLRAR